MKAGVWIALGIAVSALITTAVLRREHSAPSAARTPTLSREVPPETERPHLAVTLPALPPSDAKPAATPAAALPVPVINDIGWMLSATEIARDPYNIFGPIFARMREAHGRLLEMPDAPPWARETEMSLLRYFGTLPIPDFQVTSVACRASACEVQAIKMSAELRSGVLTLDGLPQIEANPLRSLSMDVSERVPILDRIGFYFSYRRVPDTGTETLP